MRKPKLVVMAAGLGSRFGGLKQMEPVTEEQELILDFSCYDAVKAGFEDIIFVIRPEMEEAFRKRVLAPMKGRVNTACVFQELTQLPEGYSVPAGRVKPWGTCHAVMAAAPLLSGPFAVINSDDYYGARAFAGVYDFLTGNRDARTFCMAGYHVENTLSRQGAVTRGVCMTRQGYLTEIRETKEIRRNPEGIISAAGGREIPEGTVVSMNFWGFTEEIIHEMTRHFPVFLDGALKEDPLNAEYLLPAEVGRLLHQRKCAVRVLEAADRWFGVTYRKDRKTVEDAFRRMKAEGRYPQRLWGSLG
ncbi:MAG: sugar phosphate nucleotidyltransferase [Anaerovoracaceae bacterium]